MIPLAATLQRLLQRRLPMLLNGMNNSQKLPIPLRDLHPILTHGSLPPPSLHPKRHLDRFSRFCTTHRRVSHYFTMGRYVSPKIAHSPCGTGCPSNTWYLGPTRVIIPYGILIGSAVFVWVPNAMLYNALSMGRKPQIARFLWDCVTPPKEDRATAIDNMHKSSVKFGRYARG